MVSTQIRSLLISLAGRNYRCEGSLDKLLKVCYRNQLSTFEALFYCASFHIIFLNRFNVQYAI